MSWICFFFKFLFTFFSMFYLIRFRLSRINALAHICDFFWLDEQHFSDKYTNESIYDEIVDVAPSLNQTLLACVWLYQNVPCETLFAPLLGEEGLCFTFNSINSQEIYTDEFVFC